MPLELPKIEYTKPLNRQNSRFDNTRWFKKPSFDDNCDEETNQFDYKWLLDYYKNKSSFPRELELIESEINDSKYILSLEENWDDEGALPIAEQTYRGTIRFLRNYSKHIFDIYGLVIQAPSINPCRDGSVDLSWRTPKARMLINYKNDGTGLAHYYGDYYNNINSIKGFVETNDIQDFLAAWMKVLV